MLILTHLLQTLLIYMIKLLKRKLLKKLKKYRILKLLQKRSKLKRPRRLLIMAVKKCFTTDSDVGMLK